MLAKISLLIMRIGTGMLLVLWGGARLLSDGMGTKLAEKYYGGVGAASTFQLACSTSAMCSPRGSRTPPSRRTACLARA